MNRPTKRVTNTGQAYADQGTDAQGRAYRRYRTKSCGHCVLRAQCTQCRDTHSVKRCAGDEYKQAMGLVLQQSRARRVYGRRLGIGEPVHAELRERFGLLRSDGLSVDLVWQTLGVQRLDHGSPIHLRRSDTDAVAAGACKPVPN